MTNVKENCFEWNVLYAKRKFGNGGKASKSNSKADGVLIVHPKSNKITLRVADYSETDASSNSESDDDNEPSKQKWDIRMWRRKKQQPKQTSVLYEKVQRDIAANADTTLQEDAMIVLGGYDVQIVNRIDKNGKTSDLPLLKQKEAPRKLTSKLSTGIAHKGLKRAAPLLSKKPPPQPLVTSKRQKTSLSQPTQPSVTSSETTAAASLTFKQQPRNTLLSNNKSKLTTTSSTRRPAQSANTKPRSATPSSLDTPSVPMSLLSALRPHQTTALHFLWHSLTGPNNGAILADEMGLGKTAVTIAVICALHRQWRDNNFIIVCPSSLVKNWANEFDKWIGKASQPKRVVIQRGDEQGLQQLRSYFGNMKQSTNQRFQKAGQVLLISYDLFRRNAPQFLETNLSEKTPAGLLVVDEGHRLKNKNGSLTLSALQTLPTRARLCLTATPIQNNLTEFYTLANFVCPGVLGASVRDFCHEYERPIACAQNRTATPTEQGRGLEQARKLEALAKTFVLRRLQKDVLSSLLPPRMEILLFCKPSLEQCRMYRTEAQPQAADPLATLTKLRKICSHPLLLFPKHNASDSVEASGKLQVLDTLLQSIRTLAPQDKVVIVSNFTSALTILEEHILKPRVLSFLRLDGTVKQSDRQNIVDTFNRSSSVFCLLLSSKAGGCGLNLVGANRLVMYDADWNPANDIQAMGRVYRQGQTKPCFIYRFFTAGTVEEVIYQRQSQKNNLAAATVDRTSRQAITSLTKEELSDCFTLKEKCACDTKRKMGSAWPDYEGPDSLMEQGLTDGPLLETTRALASVLGHVHMVRSQETAKNDGSDLFVLDKEENAEPALDRETSRSSSNDLEDSESEQEFEFED